MQFSTMNHILLTALVGYGLPSGLNAGIIFPDVPNAILGSSVVNFGICQSIDVFGNLLQDLLKGVLDGAIDGTNETVPPPYEKLIVVDVDPPTFDGCNATLKVNMVLTTITPGLVEDNPGYAVVKGMYEPSLTFWEQNDTFVPGVRACGIGVYMDELDFEDQPEPIEIFITNYINSQLGDPECAYIVGEDPDAEDDDEEGDDEEDVTVPEIPEATVPPILPSN